MPKIGYAYTALLLMLFNLIDLVSVPAHAWNATGHRLVARIAWDNLTPTARQRLKPLLIYRRHYQVEATFLSAATWPDVLVRIGNHRYDHWHYIDLPFSVDGTATEPPAETNVVWAIERCITLLQDPATSDLERRFSLRFLIHLVGDIHQPLHTVSRFSASYPHGDEGGNLVKPDGVTFANLHAYWDAALGLLSKIKKDNAGIRDEAIALEREYPKDHFTEALREPRVANWAEANANMARQYVYAFADGTELSSAYIQQGQALCRAQIALAGYRLADLINKTLY